MPFHTYKRFIKNVYEDESLQSVIIYLFDRPARFQYTPQGYEHHARFSANLPSRDFHLLDDCVGAHEQATEFQLTIQEKLKCNVC